MEKETIIGVLGGGQLGRMMAQAASYLVNVETAFVDAPNSPAKQVTAHGYNVDGSFKDPKAVRELAKKCSCLTVEIEHVDTGVLKELEKEGVKVFPSADTLSLIQDKYQQKVHLQEHGIPTAKFLLLENNDEQELKNAGYSLGYPYFVKSKREAYDGKGNYRVDSEDDIPQVVKFFSDKGELYAEQRCDFICELAVMICQTSNTALSYPVTETVHEDNICKLVFVPPRGVTSDITQKAQNLAKKAVSTFKGNGVYGVEMFYSKDGSILLNEIAPRPHNSGHYTIEGCAMSQFEAHLRTILDLPIPPNSLSLIRPSIMLNILGGKGPNDHILVHQKALETPNTSLHDYGKGQGRHLRKMGHITTIAPTMHTAQTLITPVLEVANKITGQKTEIQSPTPPVAIITGSDSDLKILEPAWDILDHFKIPYEERIPSAHRTPDAMYTYAQSAKSGGVKVIIAVAGGAAHLQGMTAANTILPVVGIPVKGSVLDGVDSLHSVVQMPRGVPVGCVGIGNATNAALLAVRILALEDDVLAGRYEEYVRSMNLDVKEKSVKLAEIGGRRYLEEMSK